MNRIIVFVSTISPSIAFWVFASASASAASVGTIRFAVPANAFPYQYEGPQCADGICGLEVDYFRRICVDQNLTCTWRKVPWSGDAGPEGQGGALHPLIHLPESSLSYDVVVGSVSNSPSRRERLLFTTNYYDANHVFLAAKGAVNNLGLKFDAKGFPVPSRFLKIGVYQGFLSAELKKVYGGNSLVSLVEGGPVLLETGQVDLFFTWTGLDLALNRNKGDLFEVISSVGNVNPDPYGGVAAAISVSKRGNLIRELLNRGIIASRAGNGGYHKEMFKSVVGVDLWDCESSPKLRDDPKCSNGGGN